MPETLEFIIDLYRRLGGQKYADEEVTQTQHAVQCGVLARQANSSPTIVTAALLHDIGHLLVQTDWPTTCSENLDDKHEEVGHQYLIEHFGETVAEPVRLHVASKRYLCTVEPEYQADLSPTSLKSFHDQGGLMSDEEVESFRNHPYFETAVTLRRWDDQAKSTELPTVDVVDFTAEMEASIALAKA